MAIKAQGTIIEIETATPATYAAIGQVSGITGIGSGTATENDATHLGSAAREIIMGLPDEGTAGVTGFLDTTDTTGQIAMRDANAAQSKERFRVTLVDGATCTFQAFVTQFSFDVVADNLVPFNSQLRITGPKVWA